MPFPPHMDSDEFEEKIQGPRKGSRAELVLLVMLTWRTLHDSPYKSIVWDLHDPDLSPTHPVIGWEARQTHRRLPGFYKKKEMPTLAVPGRRQAQGWKGKERWRSKERNREGEERARWRKEDHRDRGKMQSAHRYAQQGGKSSLAQVHKLPPSTY